MRIQNETTLKLPMKKIQDFQDHFGTNPLIIIKYVEDIEQDENIVQMPDGRLVIADAISFDDNTIEVFYVRGWTTKYLLWLLVHEFQHQLDTYKKGGTQDRRAQYGKIKRSELEEQAANKKANEMVGIRRVNFQICTSKYMYKDKRSAE